MLDSMRCIWAKIAANQVTIDGQDKYINGNYNLLFHDDDINEVGQNIMKGRIGTTESVSGCQALRKNMAIFSLSSASSMESASSLLYLPVADIQLYSCVLDVSDRTMLASFAKMKLLTGDDAFVDHTLLSLRWQMFRVIYQSWK